MCTFKASNTILLCVQQFHMEFLIMHRLFMLCTTVQPKIDVRRKVGVWGISKKACSVLPGFTTFMLVYHALCIFSSNTTNITSIPGLRAEPHVTTVKLLVFTWHKVDANFAEM